MIGSYIIKVNAKTPNIALSPMVSYVNSPSSVRIVDVPKKIGNWEITSVSVSVTYPDNTTKSYPCKLTAGVWICTFNGCSIAGKCVDGFSVYASGVDENNIPVENYLLGLGDVVVLSADGELITDGITRHTLKLTDATEELSSSSIGDCYINRSEFGQRLGIYDGENVLYFDDITYIRHETDKINAQITQFSNATSNKLSAINSALSTLSTDLSSEVKSKADAEHIEAKELITFEYTRQTLYNYALYDNISQKVLSVHIETLNTPNDGSYLSVDETGTQVVVIEKAGTTYIYDITVTKPTAIYTMTLTSRSSRVRLVLLATKTEVIEEKYNSVLESISSYCYTKDEIDAKGYITEHQSLSGYYTKSEIDGKGYLTEHQSLSAYATKEYVNGLIGDIDTVIDTIRGAE